MTTEQEKFWEISKNVESGNMTSEQGLESIKGINFLDFSLDEMETVENCEWLPASFKVNTIREWMDVQDSNINSATSYLLFQQVVDKEFVEKILDLISVPSHSKDLRVEDVIQTLATANGTREYLNPIETKLISVASSPAFPKKELGNIFTGKKNPKETVFQTMPGENNYALIGLPDFLKINISSYKVRSADRNWPLSWVLEGSNDKDNWTTIDIKSGANDLSGAFKEVSFDVEQKGFYRYFKITQKGQNSNGNLQFLLTAFDISGNVKIVEQDLKY